MKKTFLDFEKDIEALDEKIDELRSMQESDPSMDIGEEVDRLEQKSAELLADFPGGPPPEPPVYARLHPDDVLRFL